jgi:hypothetical protein
MHVVYATVKSSVHKAFLLFFAVLGLGEIAVQTVAYVSLMAAGRWGFSDVPFLIQTWFYGLDYHSIFSTLHIDGAWPAVHVTLLAYVGSKIPETKDSELKVI